MHSFKIPHTSLMVNDNSEREEIELFYTYLLYYLNPIADDRESINRVVGSMLSRNENIMPFPEGRIITTRDIGSDIMQVEFAAGDIMQTEFSEAKLTEHGFTITHDNGQSFITIRSYKCRIEFQQTTILYLPWSWRHNVMATFIDCIYRQTPEHWQQ